VEQADDRWCFKYSPEFKRQAVDRMMAGESVSALAKELGIARKFFYAWREAVVLDVYSRRVVGWSLGRSLHTSLPLTALNRTIVSRQPGPNLVHHSGRGSQYASDEYVKRLEEEAQNVHKHESPRTAWKTHIARVYAHAKRRGARLPGLLNHGGVGAEHRKLH
jgi:transposase InsO family protein